MSPLKHGIFHDTHQELKRVLPEVDFNITANGITVISERLSNHRFLPFDVPYKCKTCKGEDVAIDFAITVGGVMIWCNRNKSVRFVHFDQLAAYPDHCVFRVRSRGKIFNIPHQTRTTSNVELPATASSGQTSNENAPSPVKEEIVPWDPAAENTQWPWTFGGQQQGPLLAPPVVENEKKAKTEMVVEDKGEELPPGMAVDKQPQQPEEKEPETPGLVINEMNNSI